MTVSDIRTHPAIQAFFLSQYSFFNCIKAWLSAALEVFIPHCSHMRDIDCSPLSILPENRWHVHKVHDSLYAVRGMRNVTVLIMSKSSEVLMSLGRGENQMYK